MSLTIHPDSITLPLNLNVESSDRPAQNKTSPTYMPSPPNETKGTPPTRKSIDSPRQGSESQRNLDLLALLTILKAGMLIRDDNATWRRAQGAMSIQASQDQIKTMSDATKWTFIAAGVSAVLGLGSAIAGGYSTLKSITNSRAITGLERTNNNLKSNLGKEVEMRSLDKNHKYLEPNPALAENQIKISRLGRNIEIRNSGVQMLNGFMQTIGASVNGFTGAVKSAQDIDAKKSELEAAVAKNQKDLFQSYIDEQAKMVSQLIQLVGEILRANSQAMKAAGTMA